MLRWLFIVFGIVLAACQKRIVEVPVPEPKPAPAVSWQFHPGFVYNRKIQLNSYADSTRIILAGSETTAIAPESLGRTDDITFVYYSGRAQPLSLRPAFSGRDYPYPTSITAQELANTGLAGNQNTSVASFRNTMYVSTLPGVFTKPLRTFLTSKKDQ